MAPSQRNDPATGGCKNCAPHNSPLFQTTDGTKCQLCLYHRIRNHLNGSWRAYRHKPGTERATECRDRLVRKMQGRVDDWKNAFRHVDPAAISEEQERKIRTMIRTYLPPGVKEILGKISEEDMWAPPEEILVYLKPRVHERLRPNVCTRCGEQGANYLFSDPRDPAEAWGECFRCRIEGDLYLEFWIQDVWSGSLNEAAKEANNDGSNDASNEFADEFADDASTETDKSKSIQQQVETYLSHQLEKWTTAMAEKGYTLPTEIAVQLEETKNSIRDNWILDNYLTDTSANRSRPHIQAPIDDEEGLCSLRDVLGEMLQSSGGEIDQILKNLEALRG
ncbi:MAG: hypothetical protein Q9159_005231 [Coniocarpon cinnabarinum]